MKNRLLEVFSLMAGLLISSDSLLAHHNQGAFNNQVVATVTGTVKEFNWMNPHSMMILSVKDEKGESADWAIEMSPPNSLSRDNGWNDKTFKPGDHVTVDGNPYKDGRKIMRPKKVIMPDGKPFTGRM